MSELTSRSRRAFMKSSLVGSAVAASLGVAPASATQPAGPWIAAQDTVLFQGDSITDAGRSREVTLANQQPALGNGYAWLAAASLLVQRPQDGLQFLNRGVSGNKVFQLAERFPQFDQFRGAARRVAQAAGARFVAFQAMFDQATQYAPPAHWAADGVHPTPHGAALMSQAWVQAVNSA